ncbi:Formation of crista junctions protein 1 [Coelomomyces lativittatus]|nr:Formation of crista junctions protein 1 [Coelomomyces lativittatus]KAJ1510926.1 Formation of crista junctions protein 1 [Coelomomyces lativittatus]KAJ1517344.1 Formation of crista junctions protein 1 [Coelomomyces lativittatus]
MPLSILLRTSSVHTKPVVFKPRPSTRPYQGGRNGNDLRRFTNQAQPKDTTSPLMNKITIPSESNSKARPFSRLKFFFYSSMLLFTGSVGSIVYIASKDEEVHQTLKKYVPFFPWERIQPSPSTSSSYFSEVSTSLQSLTQRIKEYTPFAKSVKEDSPKLKTETQASSLPVPTLTSSSSSTHRSETSSTPSTNEKEIRTESVPSSTPVTLPPLPSPSTPFDVSDAQYVSYASPFKKISNELEALLLALGQSVPHVQPSMKKVCDLIHQMDDELKKVLTASYRIQVHHTSILNDVLARHTEKFHQQLNEQLESCHQKCTHEKQELTSQHVHHIHQLESQHQTDLLEMKTLWKEHTLRELQEQEQALTKQWHDKLQVQLDVERNGRLAKLDQLTSHVHQLEHSVNQVTYQNERLTRIHALRLAVQRLQTHLDEPQQGFQQAWHQLETLSNLEPEWVHPILSTLQEPHVSHGMTFPELQARFTHSLAPQLRPLACVQDPTQMGFFSYTMAKLSSTFFWKTSSPPPFEDSEVLSVLAQVEDALSQEDLDTATRTLTSLRGWPKVLAQDWLEMARRHLEVKLVLDTLEAQAELLALQACLLP